MRESIILCGNGYVSQQAALYFSRQDWQVFVVTRTPAAPTPGVIYIQFGQNLPDAGALLLTAPPDEDGDPYLRTYGAEIFEKFNWVGYLSSTGVYGDCGGAAVDESAPLRATSARARRRVLAETQWQATGLPLHVFRLSGIYGPQRSLLERVKADDFDDIEISHRPVNRIHVTDIVRAVQCSIQQPNPGAIYNLADDRPAPTWLVAEYAARLLQKELPPLKTKTGRSHLHDGSRVVLNHRAKNELGFNLLYPDYKAGLRALLQEVKD